MPLRLVTENPLDALWNEDFKRLGRNATRGRNYDEAPSFERTARRVIAPRLVEFADGAQAMNYLGIDDVE